MSGRAGGGGKEEEKSSSSGLLLERGRGRELKMRLCSKERRRRGGLCMEPVVEGEKKAVANGKRGIGKSRQGGGKEGRGLAFTLSLL